MYEITRFLMIWSLQSAEAEPVAQVLSARSAPLLSDPIMSRAAADTSQRTAIKSVTPRSNTLVGWEVFIMYL